jgi:uncharacterized membrane protein (DUF485 family)
MTRFTSTDLWIGGALLILLSLPFLIYFATDPTLEATFFLGIFPFVAGLILATWGTAIERGEGIAFWRTGVFLMLFSLPFMVLFGLVQGSTCNWIPCAPEPSTVDFGIATGVAPLVAGMILSALSIVIGRRERFASKEITKGSNKLVRNPGWLAAVGGRKDVRRFTVRRTVVTLLIVVVVSGSYVLSYDAHAGSVSCCEWAGKSYTFGLTGIGTLDTPTAYPWASASCVTATPCNTYNFSVSASSGLVSSEFGLRILTITGNSVTGWEAVIWSVGQTTPPLATWTEGSTSWTCLTSLCPVGGLQGTGLLIITPQGTVLTGTGDLLLSYGLGSNSVSGQATF